MPVHVTCVAQQQRLVCMMSNTGKGVKSGRSCSSLPHSSQPLLATRTEQAQQTLLLLTAL
jgi:hypothetical protein